MLGIQLRDCRIPMSIAIAGAFTNFTTIPRLIPMSKTNMTTKPSSAPWADEPFPLIEIPSTRTKSDHFYLKAASEMSHAHNVLLRSLNAILQQGPCLPAPTDATRFRAKDVKDFLHYVHCWVKMVYHHHWVEETYVFPELGKLSGKPDLMDEPQHQHESFQPGLKELDKYATVTQADQYRWPDMKQIIESFSKNLTDHLYDEIRKFLELKDLDSEEYRKTWTKAEEMAKQSSNITLLYDMVPLILGCADKSYEGGNEYPPYHWVMPYVVKYWFAAGNGAWRFNPCDFWGRPRPLPFVAKDGTGN
ncbi:hypothetical protein F4777DRAFT_548318 [Nemania sp. FL0916]|nr:hypothetical protein F4777DRAFT_548318 [Nemania sp. FL0916]